MNTSAGEIRKTCFVIAPIGPEDSDERKRSDLKLKHIFLKALEPLGYEVLRADMISQPGMITMQVLKSIMEAPLVVADMTGHNANVFYELAVRHAVEKPVIHVIEAGQQIPFDTSDLRTIPISVDLDGAERSIDQIRRQAQEIESGNFGETPLKIASIMQRLGDNAGEKEILSQILASFGPIRADIQKLAEQFEPTRFSNFPTGYSVIRPGDTETIVKPSTFGQWRRGSFLQDLANVRPASEGSPITEAEAALPKPTTTPKQPKEDK